MPWPNTASVDLHITSQIKVAPFHPSSSTIVYLPFATLLHSILLPQANSLLLIWPAVVAGSENFMISADTSGIMMPSMGLVCLYAVQLNGLLAGPSGDAARSRP